MGAGGSGAKHTFPPGRYPGFILHFQLYKSLAGRQSGEECIVPRSGYGLPTKVAPVRDLA